MKPLFGELPLLFKIILAFVLVLVLLQIFYNLFDTRPQCMEAYLRFEGRLEIIQDKYPVNVIVTAEGTYWIYEPPKDFDEYLNKEVRIKAAISPPYNEKKECNICYMRCKTCQCPMYEPLLYDVEILEVLD